MRARGKGWVRVRVRVGVGLRRFALTRAPVQEAAGRCREM